MTVKSLTSMQKTQISYLYCNANYSIPELAALYERSNRTIIRALEEQGSYEVKHRKPKPTQAPVPVVIPTRTPWWKRIFSNMKFTYMGHGEGPTA